MEPQDIQTYSIEEILESREKLNLQLEELNAAMKVLSDELLHRLNEEKKTGMIVGTKAITKAVRLSFSKVKIEQARELGATETVEVVSSKMLKNLYNQGVAIEGVVRSEYVTVREVKEKNLEE